MGTLYFLGGENISKRDAKEINQLSFEDAGSSPTILVFTWARPSFDAHFKRRQRLINYFRSLGASSVNFSEFSDSIKDISLKAQQSDLIYLTGGQVGTLLNRLRTTGVDKLLQKYKGEIVGRSAGALVLGKSCVVTNRYSGHQKKVPCLRLVDFCVRTHYEPSKDFSLRCQSKKEKIYTISNCSALVYDNGVLSSVGEVFLFENGKKTPFTGPLAY